MYFLLSESILLLMSHLIHPDLNNCENHRAPKAAADV